MAEIIEMPKLSDTMTIGTLVRWLKNEGDAVLPGDMLAEIETDKATMELENFSRGVLLKHYVPVGGQVPIGAPLCAIGNSGEAAPEVSNASNKQDAAPQSPEKAEASAPTEPLAIPSATTPCVAPIHTESSGRIKASPLAKKMAKVEGVDLQSISGTGPHGRIVRADILKALEGGASQPQGAFNASTGYVPQLVEKSIPVTGLRGTIARRLVQSKQENPHFYLEITVNAEPIDTMRREMNAFLSENFSGGLKLTVNDFILRAVALALAKVPAVNASWKETSIQQHGSVHLAFGVALEEGLVTPVVRDAQVKSLLTISQEAKSLIQLARARKLKPDQMSGSTFTVTNLGMFGIDRFYGIINPPNAGILSVGAAFKEPVVNERNEIVIGNRMSIGFSGDHRVIDGAVAAQFLGALKGFLEAPSLLNL